METGTRLGVGGTFRRVVCYRPDGTVRWEDTAKNAVPSAALDDVLNVYYRSGTPPTNFYCGLIDNASFTALAQADTPASHAGWTENTAYSQSVRPTWSPGASSGQTIVNGSVMTFTITADGNLRGCFIATSSTKGGTTGLLSATAPFNQGVQAVHNGDTLQVTFSNSATTA